MNDYYGGNNLNASNLPDGVHRVKVSKIDEVTFNDGKRKPRLHFDGLEKVLPLIKTNANRIAAVYGPVISAWPIGMELEIYTEPVQGPNGPTKGVRLRVVQEPQAAPAAAPAKPAF
jgi:hypothetical protein